MKSKYISEQKLTVGEMIEILKGFPKDAKVGISVDSGWSYDSVSYSGKKIGFDCYGNESECYLDLTSSS